LARAIYIHVYECMFDELPAKNTVYTPYIPINVCFWPPLIMCRVGQSHIYTRI